MITPLVVFDSYLFYMLSLIHVSIFMCTGVGLYIILVCTDCVTIGVCVCVHYWHGVLMVDCLLSVMSVYAKFT